MKKSEKKSPVGKKVPVKKVIKRLVKTKAQPKTKSVPKSSAVTRTLKSSPKLPKAKTSRKIARPAKSSLKHPWQFVESLRSLILKQLRSAQNRWTLGVICGVISVSALLWRLQRPLELPAPIQSEKPVALALPLSAPEHVPEPAKVEPPQLAAQPVVAAAPVVPPPVVPPAPAAPVPVATAPEHHVSVSAVLRLAFSEAKKLSFAKRVDYWSQYFWQSSSPREKMGSISDAPKIEDVTPLLSDRFDCTTFVETVAALSRSESADDFFSKLVEIRYRDGKADYVHRNHFPEVDWIPNNEKAGILSDITARTAQNAKVPLKTEEKTIDRLAWLNLQIQQRKVTRELASSGANVEWREAAHAKVNYLAVEDVEKVLQQIPDGAILNLVRKNDGKHPVLISHQGYLFRSGGTVMLRHASTGGNIRNVVLTEYLRSLVESSSGAWPVVGINLNQLRG